MCDASKFLAALLLSLTTMLHLGLPHVNVLSKLDLVATHGAPPFSLDFYTAGGDPEYLARAIEEQAAAGAPGWGLLGRHAKLTRGLCSLVADYGLVSFATLDVQSEGSVRALLAVVDRANGAVFLRAQRAAAPRGDAAPPTLVRPAPPAWLGDAAADVEERLWGRDGGDGDDEG